MNGGRDVVGGHEECFLERFDRLSVVVQHIVIQPELGQRVIGIGPYDETNRRGGTYLNPNGRIFLIFDLGFLYGAFGLVDLAQSTERRSG